MNITHSKFLIKVFIFSIFNVNIGQNQMEDIVVFNNDDIKSYQIDRNIFNFHDKMEGMNFYIKKNSSGLFTDERTYKGVLNYGISFHRLDKRNQVYIENKIIYFFDVAFDKIEYRKSDSIVKIKGQIEGGCSDHHSDGRMENNYSASVFIGHRKDDLQKMYYEPSKISSIPNELIINYKSEQLKNAHAIDSFPSFYMTDFVLSKSDNVGTKSFEVEGKIDENSILVLGLEHCYAEIFELGKLVFDNQWDRKKREKEYRQRKNEDRKEDFQFIIRNNVQELYKDTITKPQLDWYYKTIERAEELMMGRQYGKARNEYQKLLDSDHYIFARDLHNAVRVSILSRDYGRAIQYCERLALKGVPLTYFNAKIFDRLKTMQEWKSFETKFPELNKQYELGLNHKLISGLAELVEIDQIDYIKNTKGEIEKSELRSTTQRVDGDLIKLISEEGFPTEEKIGIKIYQDSMISTSNDYYVLINHSHQMGSDRLDEIKEIIKKSAQNYEYDNVRNSLGLLMNLNPCFMLYKGNLYNDKTCKLNEKELQKIEFRYNNGYGFIVSQGAMGILALNKENEAEDDKFFEERYNFIKKITDDWFVDE